MTRVRSQAARDATIRTCGENARKLQDYDRLLAMVDKLLNHCPDMECAECSRIVCPHGDPMHFHHDGCPTCSQDPTPGGQP